MDGHVGQGQETLCRLCSEHCTLHFSLFENNAAEMLESLTSIKMKTDDPFTTRVCLDCFSDLKNAFKIQQKIIENQKKFTETIEKLCVKEEVKDDVCESAASEETETVTEEMKSNVKMETEPTEDLFDSQYYGSDNSNLIAEPDYGLVEEEESTTSTLLLPGRSKKKYETTYERFDQWCGEKKISNINEKALLAYFKEKSLIQKPSSLWCNYSILKTMLPIKKNLDISKYTNLIAFLKNKSSGYQSRKSKCLTKDDFVRFVKEANDEAYLMMKVAMIIGVAGACRTDELAYLLEDNLKDEGSCIRINLENDKTQHKREFLVLPGNFDDLNLVEIVRKYSKLRPAITGHRRFFLSYRQGRCTTQPVGVNAFGAMTKNIATFLGLQNPEHYTGHSFRRFSASLDPNHQCRCRCRHTDIETRCIN